MSGLHLTFEHNTKPGILPLSYYKNEISFSLKESDNGDVLEVTIYDAFDGYEYTETLSLEEVTRLKQFLQAFNTP